MEENKIIVYLNKQYLNNKEFLENNKLQEYLKRIFINLKNWYDINVYGYFNINCFLNDYYGAILEIEQSDIDFSIYSKKTDIKFTIFKDSKILFKTKNYFLKDLIKSECNIHIYNNNYYIEIKELTEKDIAYMLENAEIIYGNEVESIINKLN